jgi:uncharacterized membrane protein YdjX (TVP38/TMEM64 family)
MGEILQTVEPWLRDLGPLAYPLAVALMTAVALLPIPAEIPAMMNGMLFGPPAGVAVTWTGAMLGAWLSFELSRRFGRPLAERLLSARALDKVDGAVRTVSWPGLLVARLVPVVAFTVLNWGLGLTACRRRTFLWTTALGILPATILFVYSGTGLAQHYARHPAQTLALAGLASAVAVFAALRRRRARGVPAAG